MIAQFWEKVKTTRDVAAHTEHLIRGFASYLHPAGEGKTTSQIFATLFVGTGVLDCPRKNDVTLPMAHGCFATYTSSTTFGGPPSPAGEGETTFTLPLVGEGVARNPQNSRSLVSGNHYPDCQRKNNASKQKALVSKCFLYVP